MRLAFTLLVSACMAEVPPQAAIDSDDPPTDLAPQAAGAQLVVCHADAVNQRSGPGTSYGVLRVIPANTVVTVVSTSGKWIQNDWNGTRCCSRYCFSDP